MEDICPNYSVMGVDIFLFVCGIEEQVSRTARGAAARARSLSVLPGQICWAQATHSTRSTKIRQVYAHPFPSSVIVDDRVTDAFMTSAVARFPLAL